MKKIGEIKECSNILECTVPIINKIASGFDDKERCALALLLFFKENKILDKLSKTRKILNSILEKELSEEEFDEFIEQEVESWKPPYGASKEDLLKMLED
ncbi:hypothetical protein [Apibacter sp. ESL0404]|uniref:hypothetical protein n=1 Tax=Apibacter sp. ESL0404 TaxID=2704651 RepID=UPI001C6A1E68|nr:hypothetical protein [Apibacter sp. ESL0404]QYN50968.1 hypothetical protein GYM72_05270 [Apibacter sp. ESL0404]